VIDLEYDSGRSGEYDPLLMEAVEAEFGPSFQLPQSVNAMPEALCELFLPDSLLVKWVMCTNDYAAFYLPPARQKAIPRIIRVNSYVICQRKDSLPEHNDFILLWIQALSQRAHCLFEENKVTHHIILAVMKPSPGPPAKRQRKNYTTPSLSDYRLHDT
jgi:hypothetical protein